MSDAPAPLRELPPLSATKLATAKTVTPTRILGGLCVGLLCVALPAGADTRPASIELVAKSDARQLFAISKRQWVEKVRHAVASGMATPLGQPSARSVGMHVRAARGTVSTVLRYDVNDEKPSALLFAIAYPSDTVPVTPSAAADVIAMVKRQMAPEFHVVGHTDLVAGRRALFLFITQLQKGTPPRHESGAMQPDTRQGVRRTGRRTHRVAATP